MALATNCQPIGGSGKMDEKELEDAISQVKMDASNVSLGYDDAKAVDLSFKQAAEHLAFARSDPNQREEHIRSGFAQVGKIRGILGKSPVQSQSFRRHQWPFIPPETDKEK
jgi:hypothetical protein